MKRHEFGKPLVQTALVLLVIFILIGFVAGSGAHGVLGGIASIFKGTFLTILFAIALVIALTVSVILLIAIYLGALAFYSPDSSRNSFFTLRQRSVELLSTLWACGRTTDYTGKHSPQRHAGKTAVSSTMEVAPAPRQPSNSEGSAALVEIRNELTNEIESIGKDVEQLSQKNRTLSQAVTNLKASVNEMGFEEVVSSTARLDSQQAEISARLADCVKKMDQVASVVQQNDEIVKQQSEHLEDARQRISSLSSEIEVLRSALDTTRANSVASNNQTEVAASDEEHRIFTYLENDDDRKLISDLVEKAIEQDLTYAAIDDFLTESLTPQVDAVLKDHPSLTREYIRSRRQK